MAKAETLPPMDETVTLPIGLIDAISSAETRADVYSAAAVWLPKVLDATRGSLALERGGRLHLVSFSGGQVFDDGFSFPVAGTLAGVAFKERRHKFSHDMSKEACPYQQQLAMSGFLSLLISPLVTSDQCLGVLHALHSTTNHFDERDAMRLNAVARWVAAQLRIQNQMERLREITLTDELTRAANRRAFLAELAERLADHKAGGGPCAVLIFDLDHFKRVNDTYGHTAGDRVLIEVVRRFQAGLYEDATLARIGGEEFGVVLPGMDLTQAERLADGLRAVVAQTPVDADGEAIPVTLSIGATVLTTSDRNVEAVMTRADQALYEAKDAGRNAVRAAA